MQAFFFGRAVPLSHFWVHAPVNKQLSCPTSCGTWKPSQAEKVAPTASIMLAQERLGEVTGLVPTADGSE